MATTNKFKDRFISLLSIDSDYKPTDPELLEKINTKGTLSYNDIGQKIGVSAQAIDNWINNRANPKTSNVEKIAALFGVSTSWLLGYEDAVLTQDTETYNHFAKYLIPDGEIFQCSALYFAPFFSRTILPFASTG